MVRLRFRSRSVSTLVALAVLGVATRASPASWPTPALGPSKSGDPEVLFTFDDGPAPGPTDKVLEILKQHGVRGVFFVVGRRLSGKAAESGRALVARILDDGHVAGNHTVDHVHLCAGSADKAARQLDEARQVIDEATGMPTVLFRAPYGNRCKRLIDQLAQRKIDHMHWDIDPQEWKSHDAKKTQAYVIRHLERLRGRAVVILHDIHGVTPRALPGILDWIAKENRRRVEAGERPIRILDPADVVLERLEPDTLPLLRDLVVGARGFAPSIARELTTPLAPPPSAAATEDPTARL